ncbi:MAG: hypothetical protein ACR2N3_05265 [Pyrinomonadaceae bacterium]
MAKLILSLFGIVLTACAHTASQSVPVKLPVNAGSKNIAQTIVIEPAEQTLSECSQKRVAGLPKGANIPQELCFDTAKPVDAKERSNAKSGNNAQISQITDYDMPFEKLPAEVQKIVRLTVPDINTNEVIFDLTIIPTPDERAGNRLVKSYSYASASKNKAAGKDPNHHSWLFKRQNNLLKLEYAEIDTTK